MLMSAKIVNFDEASHTYTHKDKGKFISVTTLLGQYKKKFDKHFHASRVAEREGVSKEMVLEMWRRKRIKLVIGVQIFTNYLKIILAMVIWKIIIAGFIKPITGQ